MLKMQKSLVAPKDKNAGRYKYRNVEDLYERIKPHLEAELAITTALVEMAGRVFLEASVRYKNTTAKGYAELEKDPKNMSLGQATGAATSYAIKYALCMLFCVDNGEDLDGNEGTQTDARDEKRLLFNKMRAAGMLETEMKAFFDNYCSNYIMQGRVLEHFDIFLNEWRSGDKERVMTRQKGPRGDAAQS